MGQSVVIIGFMGCGKSTLGKRLAAEWGIPFIDLDHYVEEKYGQTIPDIFQIHGESEFRNRESLALSEVLKMDQRVIALGGGTPCFNNNLKLILNHAHSVYLRLSVGELVNRLTRSPNPRPLVMEKSAEELKEFISQELQRREAFYLQAHQTIESDSIQLMDLLTFVPKPQ